MRVKFILEVGIWCNEFTCITILMDFSCLQIIWKEFILPEKDFSYLTIYMIMPYDQFS